MRHERTFETPTIAPVIKTLVEVRLAWGLERREVAERAGMTSRKLRMYEVGQAEPHTRYLRQWAKALGYELALRPMESAQ